jgi:hypothetical protein
MQSIDFIVALSCAANLSIVTNQEKNENKNIEGAKNDQYGLCNVIPLRLFR